MPAKAKTTSARSPRRRRRRGSGTGNAFTTPRLEARREMLRRSGKEILGLMAERHQHAEALHKMTKKALAAEAALVLALLEDAADLRHGALPAETRKRLEESIARIEAIYAGTPRDSCGEGRRALESIPLALRGDGTSREALRRAREGAETLLRETKESGRLYRSPGERRVIRAVTDVFPEMKKKKRAPRPQGSVPWANSDHWSGRRHA